MAKAEVNRARRGARASCASLRQALHIRQDRHATPHAEQAAAALASLTDHPGAKPAQAAPTAQNRTFGAPTRRETPI
jgi:hypothetical protein